MHGIDKILGCGASNACLRRPQQLRKLRLELEQQVFHVSWDHHMWLCGAERVQSVDGMWVTAHECAERLKILEKYRGSLTASAPAQI